MQLKIQKGRTPKNFARHTIFSILNINKRGGFIAELLEIMKGQEKT
jgi:hypothetical protein